MGAADCEITGGADGADPDAAGDASTGDGEISGDAFEFATAGDAAGVNDVPGSGADVPGSGADAAGDGAADAPETAAGDAAGTPAVRVSFGEADAAGDGAITAGTLGALLPPPPHAASISGNSKIDARKPDFNRNSKAEL